MPPKRTESSQNPAHQEGRLLLAIQAIKNEEVSSLRDAAHRFNVPATTLRSRLRGTTNRAECRANNHKLTQTEEDELKRWILSMDSRGAAPGPMVVRDMANLLLAKRGTTPVETVGQKWAYNFTKRTPELQARFSRRYDYQRAKQENPKVIQEYAELLNQASSIEAFLKQRSNSPPSPSKNALNQLIKGCQMAIQSGILLEQENRELRAEAQELIRSTEQPIPPVPPVLDDVVQPDQTTVAPPKRRVYTCSVCNQVGHRLNQCTQK